jgi:hypothetical protein
MGDYLLWAFSKLRKYIPRLFWLLLPRLSLRINFDKTRFGPHFGRFFLKLIWSPWPTFKVGFTCTTFIGQAKSSFREVRKFSPTTEDAIEPAIIYL